MSKYDQSLFNRLGLLKFLGIAILGLLLLARIGYGETQTITIPQPILQGSIHLQPTKLIPGDETGKIQPGTPVKLMVNIENKGQQVTPAGELYVRYAFAHPLEKETSSIIFETEKKGLPAIEPGQHVEITFDTPHQIPSLLDFVRYDWAIREYQAIAVINQKEHLIGTLALTFSTYYYPGIKKELPAIITP